VVIICLSAIYTSRQWTKICWSSNTNTHNFTTLIIAIIVYTTTLLKAFEFLYIYRFYRIGNVILRELANLRKIILRELNR